MFNLFCQQTKLICKQAQVTSFSDCSRLSRLLGIYGSIVLNNIVLSLNNIESRIERKRLQIAKAYERVLDRAWLVLGPEVASFEQSFAEFLGAKHCISVANGTDAIELALKALSVSPGDRVATVANAGMYTTTALLAVGAEPLYMDVAADSRNVTLQEVSRAIDEGVEAVVVTHLYGLAVPEIQEIAILCKNRNIQLLEDCAQAHGARVAGRRAGTFGDAASFSFYPTKNLGALGDGGAVVTDDPEVADKVSRLRQYGWTKKYRVEIAGARNSRLDEMQAAILSVFLPDLDSANERRRAIATQYSRSIKHPDIQVPAEYGDEYVAHLYVIRTTQREALREHCQACDIGTDVHYPTPDYRNPVFGDRYANTCLTNTERLSEEILTLPCFPEMIDQQVELVVRAVNSWSAVC
jgi:aminotransferase EvaB